MVYFIPRGTPVEIQRGQHVYQSITNRNLCFSEVAIDKPNELVFIDGATYILVAKALVTGHPTENGDRAETAIFPAHLVQNE